MKFFFRGKLIFKYNPGGEVTIFMDHELGIPAFNFCNWLTEDYKLIAEFWDLVYRHKSGEDVELKDVELY